MASRYAASMEDVLKDAAGTAMKGAASSESNALSGSSSSGSRQNLVPPDDIKNIAEAKAPNGPWNPKTTEKMDAGDYEYYFKDSKPEYYQTPKGNWVVTYAGVETRIYKDENGKERKEKITYSDSFVLVPNVSPGYHHVFSSEKDSAGNKEEWLRLETLASPSLSTLCPCCRFQGIRCPLKTPHKYRPSASQRGHCVRHPAGSVTKTSETPARMELTF